jgi:thiamine biosynthesis lipoprotein
MEHKKKSTIPGFAWLPVIAATLLSACARPSPEARTSFALGTVCLINLYEYGTAERYGRLFQRLDEIDAIMSALDTDSELAAVNANAGGAPVPVSAELIAVLSRALFFAESSARWDGEGPAAFDPTIGPLVRLWGIGTDSEPRIPDEVEIRDALALVDWRKVAIDRDRGTIFLPEAGMCLDLGAIAKGYAADELVRLLKKDGVKRAIIDLGGNVYAFGQKETGAPWRVGVQNPQDERGAYIGVAEVRDKAVVTSGVYERYFELDGRRYHHILSTQDGRPVDNGLVSVTIIGDESMDADALSTAAFALGWERGRTLVEALPGVEAIFVFSGGDVRTTTGARAFFNLTDEHFRFVE